MSYCIIDLQETNTYPKLLVPLACGGELSLQTRGGLVPKSEAILSIQTLAETLTNTTPSPLIPKIDQPRIITYE